MMEDGKLVSIEYMGYHRKWRHESVVGMEEVKGGHARWVGYISMKDLHGYKSGCITKGRAGDFTSRRGRELITNRDFTTLECSMLANYL